MPTAIRPEPPRRPEVEELLRLSDEFTRALYPAEYVGRPEFGAL
ncbi:hypothetical protein ACPPVW_02115 [Leifsonia sp. McL0607]